MHPRAFEATAHPLIAYLMAGDPGIEESLGAALAVLDAGADALELGLPFSDPIADGPTIQEASARALRAGVTPRDVIKLVEEVVSQSRKPVYIMTYLNPVLRMGYPAFAEAASTAGAAGVIVPDLPPELSSEWLSAARDRDLETVFLVSPATSVQRIGVISAACTGFIYLVSVYGVTGARSRLPDYVPDLVKRVRSVTNSRIALGFGVSKPEHVSGAVNAGCDGVIVGSALIQAMVSGGEYREFRGLRTLVSTLKAPLISP